MDLNMVVLSGRLTAPPDLRVGEPGVRSARLLVAVRVDRPHPRLDVLGVTWRQPGDEFFACPPPIGQRVWITGSVQRRFFETTDGRRSRLEIVAGHVAVLTDPAGSGAVGGPSGVA